MAKNIFENYTEKDSIKESLNIKKEENSIPFGDSFIFKKEDNKITWTNEIGETGKEHNSNISKLNIPKKEADDNYRKELEKLTNASTKISTAISTTVTVVATAVVVVAGAEIISTEIINQFPKIHEINSLAADRNTISFVVNLGENEEEARANEPGKSCDFVVELKCDAYEDAPLEQPVLNYGTTSMMFDNLRYETEYSVNIYQKSLLDISRSYMFDEPFKVTTGPEDVIRDNIKLEVGIDPLGSKNFYSTITYLNEPSYENLKYFSLRLSYEELTDDDGNGDGEEALAYASLNDEDPYSRQIAPWSVDLEYTGIGYVSLWGTTVTTIIPENPDDSMTEIEEEHLLISQQFDFANLPTFTEEIYNEIYIEEVNTEDFDSANQYYNFMVGVAGNEEELAYYDYYGLYMYTNSNRDAQLGFEVTDDSIDQLGLNTKLKATINFDGYSPYETYYFVLIVTSHKPEDVDAFNAENQDSQRDYETGVEIELYTDEVDFNSIHQKVIKLAPSINTVSFINLRSYHNEGRPALNIVANDDYGHIHDYEIDLTYVESGVETTRTFEMEQCQYDLNKWYILDCDIDFTTVQEYTLQAYSDHETTDGSTKKFAIYNQAASPTSSFALVDTYYNGYVEFLYAVGTSDYELGMTLHMETPNYFSRAEVIISNGSTVNETIAVSELNTYMQTGLAEFNTDTSTPDYYTVTTKYYDSWDDVTVVFEEVIDFSTITRSV